MPFDFNIYTSLLFPAFIQGVLFTVLLFIRFLKNERPYHLLLSILILLLTIRLSFWMLGFAGWYDTHNGYTTCMFYFPFNTLVLIGPTLYFYFQSLTNSKFILKKEHRWHFVLPLLWVLLYLTKFSLDFTQFYPFPNTEEFQFGTKGPYAEWDKSNIVYLVSYFSLLFYVAITIKDFWNYKRYLLKNFSSTAVIDFNWFYGLLWAVSIGIMISLLFYVINIFDTHLSYGFNWYPYFIWGFIIYFISIQGYFNHSPLIQQLQFSLFESKKTEETKRPSMPDLEEWKETLNHILISEKKYLNPELSLSDVSKLMGANNQTISRVINEGFGKNFNEYINAFRVNEVIHQLKLGAHKKHTLMAIAYDCGFNSKATFNRSFKKVTGKNPKDFLLPK